MQHLIAPSLLTADFLNLGRDVEMVNSSEADLFHLDVMDGVFVPNISFGFAVIEKIKSIARKPLDVHLMITDPDRYLERFRKAGADMISIHYETSAHLHRSLQVIRNLGAQAGVVLNPHSPVGLLTDILPFADFILLMSVNPGFGGQKFILPTLTKIRNLKKMILENQVAVKIEVDGGIDSLNAPLLVEAGADILVAGNSVFSAADPRKAIHDLKTF